MPRILIAGCGYVGRQTAELSHEAGWDVEGWTCSPESAAALASQPFSIRAVDLADRAAVERCARECEAVIQCASSRGGGAEAYRRIYLEAARNLRAAFPHALQVFVSSTSVYAQTDGGWVTEESPAEPEHETGRILRATEDFVLERGGIVARLAGIYGPGRSALLRKFLDGTAVIDPSQDRFINQAHRDDIATALMLIVRKSLERAPGKADTIYNISDNHPISQRECYEWLADRLDQPLPSARSIAEKRRRGNSNKRVSSDRLHTAGWAPRYPTFQIGMAESVLLQPL